jgi:SAM-dependent methyltransferase
VSEDGVFQVSPASYLWASRRYGFVHWLFGGADYSRAVEYPLAARLLQARAGERLLDVGAGRRGEFAALARKAGLDVTAIDERDDVGAEAADRSLRFQRADARRLPFEDESFERITAISTIEHIPDGDDRAMAELGRVLRPGGRLVVTVPFNPLKRADLYIRGGVYGREGERVFFERVYDEEELERRLIAPSGLRLAERIYLGEPGVRLSRLYYSPRGLARRLRHRIPWGPLFPLLAGRFFRPVQPEEFEIDDWSGVAAVLAFEK